MGEVVIQGIIENRIFLIRGQRVMIDRDIAELYGVENKYLNRQARNNIRRFPDEFMFKLTKAEKDELVTFCHRFKTIKHSTSLPHAFTEHGVAMLANVLNSDRAIKISIAIIRVFIKLRETITTHKELAYKLKELEGKVGKHDTEIQAILFAIRQLMAPPEPPKRRIGFKAD